MKKKFVCMLAVFVLFTSVFAAACGNGGSQNKKITLTVWEDESNISMLEPLATQFISDYRRSYPKAPLIEIKFEHQTEGSAIENLGIYGPVGTGADIVAYIHDTVGTGMNSGDLSRVIYDSELKANLTAEAVKAFTIDGDMYGYPITAESITLMYDKSKVNASQLASFESIKTNNLKIAMKTTGEGSAYYGAALFTDSVLFGAGGDDKNTISLSTAESVANLTDFYGNYLGCIENIMPEEAVDLLKNGQVHAIMATPFLWSTIKTALGNNAAVAVLPTIGGKELKPFSGYKGYGVSSHSQNPYLAHAFANYLVGKDAQKTRFINKQYLPTLNDKSEFDALVTADTTGKYGFVSVFSSSLEKSRTMPAILAMGNYWQPMQDAHTAMYNKGTDITSAFVTEQLTTARAAILK